jgi:hypothetical protein
MKAQNHAHGCATHANPRNYDTIWAKWFRNGHKVNGSQIIFRKQTNNFSDALRTCSAKMTRPNLKPFSGDARDAR